MLLLITSII
jgi:DNA-binding beta-propeller fold protein YncE